MFKLDRKLIVALSLTLCSTLVFANETKKPSIDGGVYYPIVGNSTSVYKINPNAYGKKINKGRTPTTNELKACDKDVMPDGTGLPDGKGSVEEGEELYEAQCVMCHGDFGSGGGGYPALSKGNAYELQKTLKNQRNKPDTDGPVRVFGSYWPQASTLFWYIRDAMPHTKSKTLSNDETYALVAYILNINEMKIDGEEVDDEYVLTREKFLKIKMPNVDGFVPKIGGKNGLENVRAFYKVPSNFGAIKVEESKRCMKDCQKPTAKIVRIQNGGIKDFEPPMSVERTLPKKPDYDMGFNVLKSYTDNCMPCHGAEGMGAPVVGDKDAWAKVMKKGMDRVYLNGINGINGMPPMGGASVSKDEFKKLVDYMMKKSK